MGTKGEKVNDNLEQEGPPSDEESFLAAVRAQLLQDQACLQRLIPRMEQTLRESPIEQSTQGEDASTTLEKGNTAGRINQFRLSLQLVEAALGRLADGTYGLCEICGDRIDPGRLLALPACRFCLGCQRKAESSSP